MVGNRWMFRAAAALTLALAGSAQAAVGFKAENGWEGSFDGFINAFGVDQFQNSGPAPANAVGDALGPTTDHNTFRIRTGLLPGLFGFNVASPDLGGLKLKARVGFYPQIQTSGGRVVSAQPVFGSQIDLREAFFTVEGSFGQLLAGRALNLFQGQNILTDMTLFGVGVSGGQVGAGGTTAGRIGYGYNYTSFGAQFRYTTPDAGGLKLAVQVGDPNTIDGATSAPRGGPAATEVRMPEFEAEISYATKTEGLGVHAWVSGLLQKAWFATGGEVTAAGGAAGLGLNLGGLDFLGSGFYGQGLGSFFMLQLDALDAAGKERQGGGFLGQAGYTVGGTRLGVSYGQNMNKESDADAAARATFAQVDTRRSITGGVYHNVNPSLKLVAEYTWSQTKWFGGADRSTNVVALGGFFLW